MGSQTSCASATAAVQQHASGGTMATRVNVNGPTSTSGTMNGKPVGGVTSDPRNVPTKRGESAVRNVYGLLYPVSNNIVIATPSPKE